MSIVNKPFAYDSNPQAIYHQVKEEVFLESREIGRAVYDLSADANQLKSPTQGGFSASELANAVNDKLVLFRLLGDSGLDDSVLSMIRAQDFEWNPVRPSSAATGNNSAVIFRFFGQRPEIATADGSDAATTQALANAIKANLNDSRNPIWYRVGESAVDGQLLLSRSATHAGALTLIAYEAH